MTATTAGPSASAQAKTDVRRATTAWEALMRTHAVMMAHFANDHDWSPLSLTEYDVLYTIESAGCSVRASALARELFVSQPTLSRTVDRLVDRGYIDRVPDPSDGRAALLTLTPSGRAARARVGRQHARAITRRLSAALTGPQLDELTGLLNTILEENPR